MTTYIALLRGVNLGPHKRIAMADLRDLVTSAGFGSAQTLLQSGNVIFEGSKQTSGRVEEILEREAERQLELRTDFMVRTADEWRQVIARNPFADAARLDPSHLLVMCCKSALTSARIAALQRAITGPERVGGSGREFYATFPNGIARSRLNTALIERICGTSATGRNWNTVLKLAALVKG